MLNHDVLPHMLKKNIGMWLYENLGVTDSDCFWIPAATRSAKTVLDPSEAALLR